MFEKLYDQTEESRSRFVGFVSNDIRYDFGIIHSELFFGKALVFSLQSNRCSLLSEEDSLNLGILRDAFNLESEEVAKELSSFLAGYLPDEDNGQDPEEEK